MSKDKRKFFILGIAAGALLCVVVILAVVVLYEPPRFPDLSFAPEEPLPRISIYDFALPNEVDRFLSPQPVYFREPGTLWTEEDSREFWQDPRGLAASVLARQNRLKLEAIFGKVP